ncbi:FecR domain-containing protein [Reichenbachiella sp. MALMAid0571]|uniref:FecR family protein n=1 Tax=Reichenbachiella sp. MALMAid0571 TaxID=3143939 RepID=UPI0032DFD005
MKYNQYNTNDFLKDEYFVRWVTKGDNGTNLFWEKWLQNNPDKAVEVAQAKQVINSLEFNESYSLKESEYVEMLEGVLKGKASQQQKSQLVYQPKFSWLGWAAAIALLVLSIYALIPTEHDTLSETTAITWVVKETKRGQKNLIKLGDGTVVKLNAGSSLRFPEKFNSSKREVYLEGEAFFEVTKDVNRPFSVISNDIVTTALGTSFNVNSNVETRNVRVALVTGKVKVEDTKGSSVILTPSEIVIYNNGQITKGNFDYNEEVAWRDGKLYFNQKQLKDVFEVLENWYGIEIESSKTVKGYYTGEFENNPSLEKVLDGIAFATGLEYEINNNTVNIKTNQYGKQ